MRSKSSSGRAFRRCLLTGVLLLATLAPGGDAWAKRSRAKRKETPVLWIATDRIVGFVPFTVYVYGNVRGDELGPLQLCRSEIAWIAEWSGIRKVEVGEEKTPSGWPQGEMSGGCALGELSPTPDGYDYTHAMQFDVPGVYSVRLMMMGESGRRVMSNTIRVNAF